MADLPISGLPSLVGAVGDTDPLVGVNGGVTKQFVQTQYRFAASQLTTSVTNSAILYSTSTGTPGWTGSMTNGQLLIGSTGANPVLTTITQGLGISITNAAGSITIATSSGGISWEEVTTATKTMEPSRGYVANYGGGRLVFTLPAVCAFGSVFYVTGISAGGWRINQNAGQVLRIGPQDTTVGVTGNVQSNDEHETIHIVCTVANLEFNTISTAGNLDINVP